MLAEETEGAQVSDEALAKTCFLKDLHLFMASNDQAIGRIPQLGFKELDLFLLYKSVQNFGGFDQVTAQQKWKQVYTMLGADPRSTSAATSTRRHYEKLLLPYECYLQERNRAATPPPSLKRPHHCCPSEQGEDAKKGSKRSTTERLQNPTLTQNSREISTVRITPKTTDYQTLGNPPSYYSLYPNSPPPQTNDQAHVHPQPHPNVHSHPRLESSSWAQPAVTDRLKEIGFSTGREEPLDLSCWGDEWEPTGQRPPSFSLPPGKKVPKFLNRVSPLYQTWHLQGEKEFTFLNNLLTRVTDHIQPEVGPISVQEGVIDLTTSSDMALSSQTPLSRTCGPSDITVNKTAERIFPLHTGESQRPLRLNRPFSDTSATSSGQIQTLLQAGNKDRFGASEVTMKKRRAVTSSGEQWCQQAIMEPHPTEYGAPELGFPLREQDRRGSFGESVQWNSSLKGGDNLLEGTVYQSSLCERWKEGELVSGRHSDTLWPQPWRTDLKAARPFHVRWLEGQELLAARQFPSIQLTPFAQWPPGPAMCKQEASQSSLRPSVALEQPRGIHTTTGPSEVFKGDVSDEVMSLLMQVRPFEYWRLRQLISSSL